MSAYNGITLSVLFSEIFFTALKPTVSRKLALYKTLRLNPFCTHFFQSSILCSPVSLDCCSDCRTEPICLKCWTKWFTLYLLCSLPLLKSSQSLGFTVYTGIYTQLYRAEIIFWVIWDIIDLILHIHEIICGQVTQCNVSENHTEIILKILQNLNKEFH